MSEAKLIDGRAEADSLRARVTSEVADLKARFGVTPGLAVVLVGEDPASQVYVRSKGEQSLAAGMHSVTHKLPALVGLRARGDTRFHRPLFGFAPQVGLNGLERGRGRQ